MAVKKNVEAIFPLSPMQEGMLFHSLYAPGSGVYVTQSSCLLRGALDAGLLEQAWRQAMDRHAALRTSFVWERVEKPVQVVQRDLQPPFVIVDWRYLPAARREEAFAALLEEDRCHGYVLTQAPLQRFVLIRLEEGLHRFLWSHHHLISDGWSNPLVLRDVLGWYEARRRGLTPRLPPARSFRDYIAWLKKQDLGAAETFWRRTLAGFIAPTPLILDRAGSEGGAGRSGHLFDERHRGLDAKEVVALRALAASAQVTLNTLVQGAWALLLARAAGQDDVLFGVTVSGRPADLPGADAIVGLFINTLPLRVTIDQAGAAGSVTAWLRQLQARAGEMRQFEHTPLVQVHGWSEVPRDLPLFDSLLVFENYPVDPTVQGPEVSLRIEDVRSTVYSSYPLAVLAVPAGEALVLRVKFDRERFASEAMEALLAQLHHLLRQFAASPEAPLSTLSLVAPEHRAVLPDPAVLLDEPEQVPVVGLIGAWAERTPAAPAVAQGETVWCYAELNAAARGIACELAARGIGRGESVAVEGPRSFGLIASMLGVHAGGGALVPLDPALPAERRRAMLRAAGVRLLVRIGPGEAPADAGDAERVAVEPGTGRVVTPRAEPDGPLPAPPGGDDPAYVFFTSGTTGVPKGVLGRHRGLSHFLTWQRESFGVAPGDRAAQLTGLSFDVVMRDIFVALVSGATLCLPPAADLEPAALLRWLDGAGITLLHTVPSIAQAWLAEAPAGTSLAALRRVFFAGEPLTAALVRRWREAFGAGAELVNLYGPTETTLAKCCFRVPAEPSPGVQPVGRPLPQTQALVLSPKGRPCGIGEPGEIAIRTPFRSLGYLGLAEEERRRFVPNPATRRDGRADCDDRDGDLLYLTGDRGRFRPDGLLEVLGRLDDQIKIRGVRVEPAEVAAVLARHPAVRSCFVLGRKDERGEASLVAYAVTAERDEAGLRAWLGRSLPPAMVPSAFVFLERMPLTPNGKVDRRALPAPVPPAADEGLVAPRTPAEELLAGIWAQVLRRERVGALDSFFALGGHSLLATQVMSRVRDVFGVELPLRALFEEPDLAGLAARVETARLEGHGMAGGPISHTVRGAEAPLSFAQQRLWFLHQLEPASPVYNIPGGLRLRGDLDVEAFARTLDEVARRHEVLRTTFAARDGAPVQVVHPPGRIALPRVDLSALPAPRREEELRRLAAEEAARPFDLARGPLLRLLLARLETGEHAVLFTLHHIVSDGWSRGVFVREIAALYPALAAGEPSPLPELPIQYADFAVWQREWLRGDVLAAQLGYWRRRLGEPVPALELPTDRPRPPVRSFRGARLPLPAGTLDAAALAGLRALGRRAGATLFMTLLAAYQALLSRVSGQEDFAVGAPVANRNRSEAEGLIGFFVNTLVMRADLTGGPAFQTLLERAREAALGAYAHQDLPFEQLVEELQPERRVGQTPLFQVQLVVHNAPRQDLTLPGLELTPLAVETRSTKFDLGLTVLEAPAGAAAALEYSTELFDAPTALRLAGHLGNLARRAAAHPETPVADLSLLSEAEEHQLVTGWNEAGWRTPWQAQAPRCIHHAFAERAARQPAAEALVAIDGRLTFAELERRAHRLAHHLRALGVGPESRVGLLLERSAALFVGMLGILEAGGAYVPIDPGYPAERVAFMLEDAGLRALVTREALVASLAVPASIPIVRVDTDAGAIAGRPDHDPAVPADPGQAAYVIYTSGSTGRPKGVVIEHRQLWHYASGVAARLGLAGGLSYGLLQPPSFDSANTVIFPSLLQGGALHVLPEDDAVDPLKVAEWFRREGIDCVKISPSHLAALLATADPAAVLPRHRLVLGGEASRREWAEQVARLAPGCAVFNHYGPTETTVGVMTRRLEPGRDRAVTVPIGLPLPGSRTWVLDRGLRPCPVGVPGELYIGGDGVGRGYLGRPELTAERFVPNPFPLSGGPGGERLYRTGDLVRRLADGNVEFLGRLDHQVKVRGFRIELSEIEAALSRHPGVRDGAVTVWEDAAGELRLAAYVVPRASGVAPGDLRDFLRERLPEPMVPLSYTILEDLPRNRHGKLDRRLLSRPEATERVSAGVGTLPRTPAEEVVAAVWAEVLGRESVGVHDDFFALGGHSLLATRIVSRLREAFSAGSAGLPVRALFEAPTVAGLAARLTAGGEGGRELPPIVPLPELERQGDLPLSFSQERLWFLSRLEPGSTAYNVAGAARLLGALDADLFRRALGEVVRRHEALRTTFSERDGVPMQVVHSAAEPDLAVVDLALLPTGEREARVLELATAEGNRPFDLERGPLARFALLRLSGEEHVALFTLHHIVSDAWSREILVRELAAAYQALREGGATPRSVLPELPVQYADFAAWQRRHLAGEVLGEHLRYWRGRLAGVPPVLEIPADRPRPPLRRGRGGRTELRLPQTLGEAVRRQSRSRGATPFMTLLTAFFGLLYRYTGQTPIPVGFPIANRNRLETEGLIGFFANTLVLRADPAAGLPFSDLLGGVREAVLDAHAHQDMPFERLVDALQPRRDLSHTPLFQVMFVMQSTGRAVPAGVELPGLTLLPVDLERGSAKFDLSLLVEEGEAGFGATLQYDADLFDGDTARRQLGHWANLLAGALADPSLSLGELPLLGEEERGQLLTGWNGAAVERPAGDALLHELFQATARRVPDATAVLWRGAAVSYGELARRAALLAIRLCGLGVGPEVPVGVCLRRTPDLLVGLLAILEAGGAYVPLDPAYPRERLAFMLEDSGAPVLVTEEEILGSAALPELCDALAAPPAVLCLEGLAAPETVPAGAPPAARPANLAYLIYTSGSTGRPKGVAITHGSAVEMVRWAADTFAAADTEGLLAATSVCFDLSVFELFAPLGRGGTVVLAENALDLHGLPDAGRVTQVNTVPSAMTELLRLGAVPPSVRTVSLAGEPLQGHLVEEVFRRTRARVVWNLYGPSEDTTYSTQAAMERGWTGTPSIGVPVANTRALVLDADLRLLPAGVPGELYLGGAGLARGYLGRSDLTAERFVPDPFGAAGARLYRTGDLVRRRASGELDFLGRLDHQVKVRGFRIELGEIEAALLRAPGVREAVVVARPDAAGEPRLVAYVSGAAGVGELRDGLRRSLPEFMVPASWVVLDALPLTPNGKVDRKALPALEGGAALSGAAGFVPPRTPTEERVAAIWSEVLGLDPVGAEDVFFEVGGHSLAAVRVLARLREVCGVDLPLRRLFEAPTVAGLARAVDAALGGTPEAGSAEEPLDLAAEAVLAPEISPRVSSPAPSTPPSTPPAVLLTGATGFLGAHLLAELLQHGDGEVHCLVRARDEADAGARLRRSLEGHGLWNPGQAARVVPVPGDLARPRLGLSAERFEELAEAVGSIYHNGAWVNLSYPYRVLQGANVLGTHEVLRLAATGSRVKPVHHVSTLSVFFAPEHAGTVAEDDPLEHGGGAASGYARSKWVAERLVREARARGIPVSVYRFGRVSWHTATGIWNPDDFLFQVLRACAGLGLAPDVDLELDLVPVDAVSRAIVALARREAGRSFHLVNPAPARWKDLVSWLGAAGRPLELVPYAEWMRELERAGEPSPLLALAALRAAEERPAQRGARLRFDDRNTREGLAGTGVAFPTLGPEPVARLLRFATSAGLMAGLIIPSVAVARTHAGGEEP